MVAHTPNPAGKGSFAIMPLAPLTHGLPLSWFQMDDFDITILALHCRAALTPLPRDGEVPFIRSKVCFSKP
jgi:hypothetical protein